MSTEHGLFVITVAIGIGIVLRSFVQSYHPELYPWTGLASLGMILAFGVALTVMGYYGGRAIVSHI